MCASEDNKIAYVKWKTGFGIVEFSVSKGSKISKKPVSDGFQTGNRDPKRQGKPFSYVATKVAKLAIFCKAANSSNRLRSSVRTNDCNLSAQNLIDLLMSFTSVLNAIEMLRHTLKVSVR